MPVIHLQTSPHQGVILEQRVHTHNEKKSHEQESTESYPLPSPFALTSLLTANVLVLLALIFVRGKGENESFSRVFSKQPVYSHTA